MVGVKIGVLGLRSPGLDSGLFIVLCFRQEIIKVREWVPHIGPLAKVITLELLLDIIPSSSEDVTRAMRGQSRQLWRNYLRLHGENVIVYVLISFHSKDVFCALSRLFVRPDFRLFSARLAVHYLSVYLVLRSSIKQTLKVTATSTMTVTAWVIILCSFQVKKQ